MIAPQSPLTDQYAKNITNSVVQQLPASELGDILQKGDSMEFVKKLVLGYLVKKSIKNNEAKDIKTGVEITDLTTGDMIVKHKTDTKHFAASINKLPVMMLIMQDVREGKLTLDQKVSWSAEDVRAGAGVYDQPEAPTEAPLKDVIFDLLNRSGNTAVRVLVNQGLGGPAAVNERWSNIPELANTRLQLLDDTRFYLGDSTAGESLWAMLQLVNSNTPHVDFLKDAMKQNIYTDFGVRSQLAGSDYITLVNKVGILDDPEGNNRHDVGVIYNTKTQKSYAYSFFTTASPEDETATPMADQSLKDMGRQLLRYSGDKKPQHAPLLMTTTEITERETKVLY